MPRRADHPADFGGTHDFHFTALVTWFVDPDLIRDELAVVLVRRYHKYLISGLRSLLAEGADHIVGFITIQFHAGNIESRNNLLYIGYRCENVFRRFLPVCLVIGEIGMSFRRRVRVKANRHVRRFLLGDQFHQGIGKSKLGVCILSF